MTNPLTGDFDAVVQLAVRQINGLLATLHQNGASTDTALKLLHSVRARVGDVRRRTPDVAEFGDWVVGFERARPAGPRPPLREQLIAGAPPGVARRLETTFGELGEVLELPPPEVVRGTAALQLSTVRLSVPEGSSSEVTVHADVRAHYEPDPGTASLPAAVNGEVRAVYEVRKVVASGKTKLLIRPSPQDQKIEFIPAQGSGLTNIEASLIAVQVRKVLREGISLLPVDLPQGFPFADFKGVGTGPSSAIALPLQLSNKPAPSGGIQGITQSFVGASGFAFGVSREHVQGLIDVEAIRQRIRQRTIRIGIRVFGRSIGLVTYRLRFSSGPALTFQAGAIEISGRVEVETSRRIAPDGFVSFKQRVTLVLDPATQRVDLETAGEPNVDESWFIPHSTAVNIVKSEIATAIEENNPAVRDIFKDARSKLATALQAFERSASVTYTQLEISPHGVIVHGELSSAQRIAPVVQIGETDLDRAFTAFQSWMPGGRIDRFLWSWVEYPLGRPTPWSGVAKSVAETNRFILEKPPGISEISQICLRVAGERIRPDGRTESIVVGRICEVGEPVMALDAPSWWEPVMVPVWRPDLPEGAVLRDGITAHISVQTDRPQRELMQNALVFFPDWRSSTPFDALVQALKTMRRQEVALAVFVIVPEGSFDSSRREFEARLAALPAPLAARVQVAEDIEGGWSRTFDVSGMPSLFLINARREFVWSAAGELDPATVAAALDERIVPAPGPRFRPLRLHVSVGERAPDVAFRADRGEEGALHRLGGRSVLFNFWQSWSAPCLAELRRLQAMRNADARNSPSIVAFHGSTARKSFDDIRKEHGLTFAIVQDAEHQVARTFGVRCWPTTIAIDPDGVVEHIQLGIGPDLGHEPSH